MQRSSDDTYARSLLTRIADSDDAALMDLYVLEEARLKKFARYKLRDDHLAITVCDDTFMVVRKIAATYRGEGSVQSWLIGIAKLKILEIRRSMGMLDDEIIDDMDISDLGNADGSIKVQEDSEQDKFQERQIVRDCLHKLNDTLGECLVLVYIEGLDQPEVADIQGVSVATVKRRISEAKTKLENCISRAEGDS